MSNLPTDAAARKAVPLCTGVLDYFPDALADVARCSQAGTDQHHPGAPLHWDKSVSADEADALARHLVERGTRDKDGLRHSAKVAWRALALLQREIDAENQEGLEEKEMNELKKSRLTDEVWREYQFPTGARLHIANPVALYTRPGGSTHRVLDAEGLVYCVAFPGPQGATVLRWKPRDPKKPVAF